MPTRFHVAVRRPDDDAILVLSDGSMPGFGLDDAPPWPVVTPVVERLHADLGLEVVALRVAWSGGPDAQGRDDRLVEVVLSRGRPPSGARWVTEDRLETRPTPLGKAIAGGALRPRAGDRQPWYAPGWYAEMSDWIDARLGTAGIRRHGRVRQVRSWGRSSLSSVETDRGRLWAKQVPAVFVHEVGVTGLLADVDPGIVPPLVAADAATGRLLLEHVDGPILADEPDAIDAWVAAAARHAELQRVMAADLRALEVSGVPHAPLGALAARVPALLDDRWLLRVGDAGGLTVAEHDRLLGACDELVAVCAALDAERIGPSVEHGDLSAHQVIVGEMGPVFLDWSDATIAHPFLAAASFLDDHRGVPVAAAGGFREAYLAASAVGGRSTAETILELARVVHPLHMVQAYADRILPALEQPWELEHVPPRLLRSLIPRLADLPRVLAS